MAIMLVVLSATFLLVDLFVAIMQGSFCYNYAVRSFCSIYAGERFCSKYVSDDFY